jgi:hypothetical protein
MTSKEHQDWLLWRDYGMTMIEMSSKAHEALQSRNLTVLYWFVACFIVLQAGSHRQGQFNKLTMRCTVPHIPLFLARRSKDESMSGNFNDLIEEKTNHSLIEQTSVEIEPNMDIFELSNMYACEWKSLNFVSCDTPRWLHLAFAVRQCKHTELTT